MIINIGSLKKKIQNANKQFGLNKISNLNKNIITNKNTTRNTTRNTNNIMSDVSVTFIFNKP